MRNLENGTKVMFYTDKGIVQVGKIIDDEYYDFYTVRINPKLTVEVMWDRIIQVIQ